MSKVQRKKEREAKKSVKQVRTFRQRIARDTNKEKLATLDALYAEWSKTAQFVSDKVWCYFLQFNQMPEGLKSTGDVNSALYVFPETKLVASQKDCMLANALGALKSWLSNLDNRFNTSFNQINRDSPEYDLLAHELCWINSNHLWRMPNEEQNQVLRKKQAQQIIKGQAAHDLKLKEYSSDKEKLSSNDGSGIESIMPEYQLPENVVRLRKISPQATRIARTLYEKHMVYAKTPSSANQPLTVNVNSATRSASIKSEFRYFSHWISIASLERGKRILLPLEKNEYLDKRLKKNTPIKQTMSIVKNNGFYEVCIYQEWKAQEMTYPNAATDVLGIDLGLNTLLASSEGDLLGEDYLKQLYHLDAIYQKRLKVVQKANIKPGEDQELKNILARTRERIKSFIRHQVKTLIKRRQPAVVRIEQLDFMRKSENKLSKRLERLVRNFGQKTFNSALEDLSFEVGFRIEKVASAYTSQTCSHCGFSCKANRSGMVFKCLSCGYKGNADANAAKNIAGRSDNALDQTTGQRKNMWLKILRSWLERKLELMKEFKLQPSVISSIVANALSGFKSLINCKTASSKMSLNLQKSTQDYIFKPDTENLKNIVQLL